MSPPLGSVATPEVPTNDASVVSPTTDRTTVTDTSDVTPIVDASANSDVMDHEEYLAHKVSGNELRRLVRGTSKPTLWRHQRRPMTSICVFDAVDNGVALAKTGLVWYLDGKPYQIVLVASLGWAEQRNRRSSAINYSNPIYVILRRATLQGRAIKFNQLTKIVASALFREGTPEESVHVPTIHYAEKQVKLFVKENQRRLEEWANITYLRTQIQKLNERLEAEKMQRRRDAEMARKLAKKQQREEIFLKKQQLAAAKRAEQQAKRQAQITARKIAKAEQQKRARNIRAQVKAAVLTCCKNLEDDLEKTLTQSLSDVRSEIETDMAHAIADVREKFKNAVAEVRNEVRARGGLVDDCGVRLTEIEANMDTLKQSWEKYKSSSNKKFREIQKQVRKLKQQDENDSEAPPPRKRVKQYVWADVNTLSSVENTHLRPPVQTMYESMHRRPTVPTMPITMQTLGYPPMMAPTPGMYQQQQPSGMSTPQQPAVMSTPTPTQSSTMMAAPTHNSDSCRYVSPIFGQRNYNIRTI